MKQEIGGMLGRVSALAAVAFAGCVGEAPDVGTVDPVYVPPAEDIRIYALARGQTFGELLDGVILSLIHI